MKKLAFIVIMSFVLFVASDTILADANTEYDTALKYYNSGKYKEAVRLFKEYAKKKPEPSAYYCIGYALYKLGEYDEASEYFKAAYLVDPMFSPGKIGSAQKYRGGKGKKGIKPSGKRAPSKQKPHVPARMHPWPK